MRKILRLKALASIKKINRLNREFWHEESDLFQRRIERHPEKLLAAIQSAQETAATYGIQSVQRIEVLMAELADDRETLGFAGGRGKRSRYLRAHAYFHLLYLTWSRDPARYRSITKFSLDASERIKVHCGSVVKPSTIRQWMKNNELRRPRPSKS